MIFANAVIFVEGEGDRAVVEKLLGNACQSPGGHYALGVTVIDAAGLGKIKYLGQLAEHFNVRSYVLSDVDGMHKRSGSRVLPSILRERRSPLNDDLRDALISEADRLCESVTQALDRQRRMNELLAPYDVFTFELRP